MCRVAPCSTPVKLKTDGLRGYRPEQLPERRGVIPSPIDQNRCAQSRNPIDIMVQG
jgi:hypothetical protein